MINEIQRMHAVQPLVHYYYHLGGNRKPTPFMCLVMKMLQIQPDKDIVVEFIKNDDYKYVRILGAFYMRLTGTVMDVYQFLEPLYNDYRKLRRKLSDGNFCLTHADEVTDELLTTDYSCDIGLPRLQKRDRDYVRDYDRGRDRDRDYDRDRDRGRDRDRDRDRDRHHTRGDKDYGRDREREREREGRERDRRDRDRGQCRSRSRSRSRSRDRRDHRDRDRKDGDRRRRHAHSSISPRRRPEDELREPQKKKKKEKKSNGTDHPDPEIAEANRLRASLGLKPLQLRGNSIHVLFLLCREQKCGLHL